MWLADDDPVRADHLERESLLGYFFLLNNKMAKAKAIETERRNRMKQRGRKGNH